MWSISCGTLPGLRLAFSGQQTMCRISCARASRQCAALRSHADEVAPKILDAMRGVMSGAVGFLPGINLSTMVFLAKEVPQAGVAQSSCEAAATRRWIPASKSGRGASALLRVCCVDAPRSEHQQSRHRRGTSSPFGPGADRTTVL